MVHLYMFVLVPIFYFIFKCFPLHLSTSARWWFVLISLVSPVPGMPSNGFFFHFLEEMLFWHPNCVCFSAGERTWRLFFSFSPHLSLSIFLFFLFFTFFFCLCLSLYLLYSLSFLRIFLKDIRKEYHLGDLLHWPEKFSSTELTLSDTGMDVTRKSGFACSSMARTTWIWPRPMARKPQVAPSPLH